MMIRYIFPAMLLVITLLLCACNEDQNSPPIAVSDTSKNEHSLARPPGCINCHSKISQDQHQNLACTDCHKGNNDSADKQLAHNGLLPYPASPSNMGRICGKCHTEQLQRCTNSLHFTVKNAVNLTRKHFGAKDELNDLTQIPTNEETTTEALVDDMLRRRCLRCHVYSSGDTYPYIFHGQGCAACHLHFYNGKLQNHTFLKVPGDWQCMSCHYGNHVGADYYGQYEHDYNWEYRTPYATTEPYLRPYGVEVHDLAADIHQQKGLACLDCHKQMDSLKTANKLTCRTCHDQQKSGLLSELKNIRIDTNTQQPILTDHLGKEHLVPPIRHPAHKEYGNQVACQVCHAQWVFNDSTTHLLRSKEETYDFMERLTTQASSWIEFVLEHNLYSDEEELDPIMADGITGLKRAGLWYKGFSQRRWEKIIVQRDKDGIIKVFRPILNLQISDIDEEGTVHIDNLSGTAGGLLPYVPHTTGPAGLFYRNRFAHLLKSTPKKRADP